MPLPMLLTAAAQVATKAGPMLKTVGDGAQAVGNIANAASSLKDMIPKPK